MASANLAIVWRIETWIRIWHVLSSVRCLGDKRPSYELIEKAKNFEEIFECIDRFFCRHNEIANCPFFFFFFFSLRNTCHCFGYLHRESIPLWIVCLYSHSQYIHLSLCPIGVATWQSFFSFFIQARGRVHLFYYRPYSEAVPEPKRSNCRFGAGCSNPTDRIARLTVWNIVTKLFFRFFYFCLRFAFVFLHFFFSRLSILLSL